LVGGGGRLGQGVENRHPAMILDARQAESGLGYPVLSINACLLLPPAAQPVATPAARLWQSPCRCGGKMAVAMELVSTPVLVNRAPGSGAGCGILTL